MKKVTLATAVVMAMGSTSATAVDIEGGQFSFHDLASAITCSKVIPASRGDESTDDNIYLETIIPVDTITEIADITYGAKAEPFSIVLNCKDASRVIIGTKASLLMVSSFGNTKGIPDDDTNLAATDMVATKNVNITIYDVDAKALMKVNSTDVHEATLNTSKIVTYYFVVSHTKAVLGNDVAPGHVTTNAIYIFTYQ